MVNKLRSPFEHSIGCRNVTVPHDGRTQILYIKVIITFKNLRVSEHQRIGLVTAQPETNTPNHILSHIDNHPSVMTLLD